MTSLLRNETARWLGERDNFCILTHDKPDGDTLGSAAGLCLGLRALGKTAVVLENPGTPRNLAYLCRDLTVEAAPENAAVVTVDTAAAHLLPEVHRHLLPRVQLRIDHHGTAESYTPLELVDPTSGACGEIIYDLLEILGVELTGEMAVALYTATATDTGCFRFANTTDHTFRVAAACAATSADLYPINQALFDTVSLSRLRLQGWVTEHTRFYRDGQVAVCALPASLEQELGISEEDMGGLAGFVRSIEGVCLAATLREGKDGHISISLRAVPGWNAAAVCEKFGGGGHKGAAGSGMDCDLAQAEKLLTQAMLEQN